jgi:hypothetical protein
MQFRDSPTFWRSISPPSSGSKSKPRKKPTEATDFLLGSYFKSEGGGDMLLSNVRHPQNYMALQSRRLQSS